MTEPLSRVSPDIVQMVADTIIEEMFAPHEIPLDDRLAKLYREVAQKVLDRLNGAAQAVPHGWKLVPLVPTPAMIEVGCENNPTMWNDGTPDGFSADVANDVYVSMVRSAAAPSSPAPDGATILKAADELHDLGFEAGWMGAIEASAKIADNNGWEATAAQIRALSMTSTQRSPPLSHAPHNSGERLPSSDAAAGGGDTGPIFECPECGGDLAEEGHQPTCTGSWSLSRPHGGGAT